MIETVKTEEWHVIQLIHTMREEDKKELRELAQEPADILTFFKISDYCRTILVNGKVAVIGGLSGSGLGLIGEIWLFTSAEVEKIKMYYFKEALRQIKVGLELFEVIRGWVSPNYPMAVEFVKRLGFTLHPGPKSLQFHMER